MSLEQYSYVIRADEAGSRLDTFLGHKQEMGSRSRVAALIRAGAVTVNGAVRAKSYLLSAGQTVFVQLPCEEPSGLEPQDLPVGIVFEDRWLLVVDKPAGMVTHPSKGHPQGTLVNALLAHGLAGGEEFRPGIVHRLDKDTSGLLAVAKSAEMHRELVNLLQRRKIDRRYLALVHGNLPVESGTIDAPIGRDPLRRKSMVVGGTAARQGVTHFEVKERFADFTLVEARLETGRTHQIRAHFLAIGHPVAGDQIYARRDSLKVGRQFLHSYRLRFIHPFTGQEIRVESPLPEDLAQALARLRKRGRDTV